MAIAIYARKSIERENSISCETQIDYCKMMIRPEEQSETLLTFVDNGFSGGNTDREGFKAMMKQVEAGVISKVVCYRLDRISRSLSDFVQILETLKNHNVQFVSSQESFDTGTPYGEMICQILMVFAEFERKSIVSRITQAYAHRSDMAFYMGGKRPYGFNLTDCTLQGIKTKMFSPVEEEIEHVKRIFSLYAVQEFTLRRVMDHLIKHGMVPKEGSWSTAKISAIIRNPIYVRADNSIYEFFANRNCRIVSDIACFDGVHGVQLYGRNKHTSDDWSDLKIVVMPHEGVIDAETWLACQRKVLKNKQIGKAISNQTSWLGGKVFCKKCGRRMSVKYGGKHVDGSKTRYFICSGKANRTCDGVKATLYAESLEDMVHTLLTDKISSLSDIKRTVHTDVGGKLNGLRNRLSEIKLTEEKLVDMMMNGSVESDMLKLLNERARKLAEEKRAVIEEIEKLEGGEEEIMSVIALSERWKTATYEEKKAVVAVLIDKINIDEDGTTEVVWNI